MCIRDSLSLDASAILFSVPVVYRGILLVHGTYSMVVQVPDETAPTVLHGDVRLAPLPWVCATPIRAATIL